MIERIGSHKEGQESTVTERDIGVRDGVEGLLHDQACRRKGSTRSVPRPFEGLLFLEKSYNLWYNVLSLLRSEDWHMLRLLNPKVE